MTGRKRSDLDQDEMLLLAVLKAVETIGEASAKVSEPTRARLPGVDWWAVRRMRNRIIHGYDTIDKTIGASEVWVAQASRLCVSAAFLDANPLALRSDLGLFRGPNRDL